MYQQIQKELIHKGFFESNGILTKFVGTRLYEVVEDHGEIRVETSFSGDTSAKNQLLDYVQDLAQRYSLAQANIRQQKLRVDLTPPGDDALLEATRIDFLTQSLESGITRFERFETPAANKSQNSPHHQISVNDNSIIEDAYDYDLADDQSYDYYDIKDDAIEDFETDERVSMRQVPFTSHPSHHKYVPPEANPNHDAPLVGVVTGLIDRSFSLLGFLGAVLGATLGAILMSAIHALGAPVQLVAFLIPFLIIGIYRVMAGNQMSIGLGIFLVLGSLLMGSVLISAIELLQQTDMGLRSALWEGLATHYNNEKYFVTSVWIRLGLSAIAASIPTMLLLTGGKRKIKYSK